MFRESFNTVYAAALKKFFIKEIINAHLLKKGWKMYITYRTRSVMQSLKKLLMKNISKQFKI